MRCEELMRRPVEFSLPGQSIVAAARKMRDANIGFLPVCDPEGRVIGTVTDRDLTIRAYAAEMSGDTKVEEVMTKEVVACRPSDEITRAEELMVEHHKSRIVVTEPDGRLAGVISLSDVAEADQPKAAETLRAVSQREIVDVHGHKQDDPARAVDELKRLRDEVRVRIHLAGMDAKKAWNKLEPRIEKLDRQVDAAGARVSAELRGAIDQTIKSLKSLRDRL